MRDALSLAELLRQEMAERGFTLRQLVSRSDVPRTTMYRWLSGESVHPYHRAGLLRVAAGLGLRKVDANRLLCAAGFPSLAVLAAAGDPDEVTLLAHWSSAVRNNLPADLTSFVGRGEEITTVAELVCHKSIRLVTLTGTGGSGKTRLALRIAEDVLDGFPDGVFFVSLSAVSDPQLVIQAIAETIGLRDVLDAALPTRLVGWLRPRRVLLLLDNLEQLVDSGPDITGLLRAAPNLKVLATSRIPLHVSGEHEWAVHPFPVPSRNQAVDKLRENPAVELFIQRAHAANPQHILDDEDLLAVGEICTRLDGVPLAIELAAAWTRDREPGRLLADFPHRLDLASGGPRDVARRQQTLRDTIAWSVDLLPAPARTLLLRLTVFVGSWTTDAARAICGPDDRPTGAVDRLLETLVDAHLSERISAPSGAIRYRMLETIREYGLERRAEAGDETALHERHARYFLDLAESAPPYVPETRTGDWYERVDADLDNVRAALDWANGQADLGLVARFTGALWPYWYEYLRVTEGRRWIESVLGSDRKLAPTQRAWLLTGATTLWSTQSTHQGVSDYANEALVVWRQLNHPRGQALVLRQLGWRDYMLGTGEQAVKWFSNALEQWRRVGDSRGIAGALNDLALASCVLGDLAAAVPYFTEVEEWYRGTHDALGHARLLRDRGLHALLCGDVAAAIRLLSEAAGILRTVGPNYVLPGAVFYLGTALCFAGRLNDAIAAYLESLRIHEELADMPTLALALLGFAAIAHRQGNGVRAAILCGAEHAMRQSSHLALPPAVEAIYAREIELVRHQLDEAAFAQAFAQGTELTTTEALAFARAGIAGR